MDGLYVDRDQAGKVVGRHPMAQRPNHEFLPLDHPDLNPPPSLADLQQRAVDKRYEVEVGGITRGDLRLPTSREKRAALKDLADKMRDGTLASPTTVGLSASVARQMTLAELDAALNQIALHCQATFDVWGQTVLPHLGASINTFDQIENANWPSNA